MHCFGISGLALFLLGVAQSFPQFGRQDEQNPWPLGQGQEQNPWLRPQPPVRQPQAPPVLSVSSSTTTTAPPTTQSPQYLGCLQTCLVTSEYNPICASDNNNYYNQSKFNCAQRCGLNIQRVHQGVCRR